MYRRRYPFLYVVTREYYRLWPDMSGSVEQLALVKSILASEKPTGESRLDTRHGLFYTMKQLLRIANASFFIEESR